jgi:hypothetical protein
MAKGKPGADSSTLVTHRKNNKTLVELAIEHFGEPPVFWGRYFKSVSATGNVEYRHRKENQILRDNNIRLLPVGRQTNEVNLDEQHGITNGTKQVEDFILTFGADVLAEQGSEFLLFLDVEGPPHSLSASYYTGWAQTVVSRSQEMTDGAVTVLPCVYAPQGNISTFRAIARAISDDPATTCNGLWIARLLPNTSGCVALHDFDDDFVDPGVELPCKVLVHQYSFACHGDDGFDCNQTNPSIDLQGELLDRLVLPPPVE